MQQFVQFTQKDGTIISGKSNAKIYFKQNKNLFLVWINHIMYILSASEKETFHCIRQPKSSPTPDKQSLK